jgi:RimJ/RimL family protein N-acetyltransferase
MSFDAQRLGAALCGARSDRLRLRAPRIEDAVPLFDASRHPAFNQHLMWDAPHHLSDAVARMQGVLDRAKAGICTALSVVEHDTARWAALFRFEPREEPQAAEIGLWSHPAFWGAGHGEELTRLAIGEAFARSELHTLVACAKPQHIASCKLLTRCGLQPFGQSPRRHESGHHVVLTEFRLTRERWNWLRADPDSGWMPAAVGLVPAVRHAAR